ncbi:MAG: ABC transporter permease [Eubacteriales bacterium]|nr:ABC transporter permease [Eubacteriales bacterium]
MRIAFKIASRFLLSNKGQTILIALGIAIGISVQIFIGSLISGLQKSLIDTTIGNASQITIVSDADDRLINNYEALARSAKRQDLRLTAVSPVLDQPGLIINDERSESILLRGFDFNRAEAIYEFSQRILVGKLPVRDNQAMIGIDLAQELGASAGDTIEVTVLNGQKRTYLVTGIFDLKVQTVNKTWFLTTLSSVQDLFAKDGQVTSIEMQIDPAIAFESDLVAADLLPIITDPELKITNWKAQNESLLSGLNGQSVSSYMIQFFVVVSVVLGIASVLAISVLQKSKQIGILKAMGIRSRQSSLIFLFQGLILGLLGGILGLGIGLGLAYSFTQFAVRPDGTPVVALYIDQNFLILSFFLAVVSSTLAALVPARKSAKLDPIEVIRNG